MTRKSFYNAIITVAGIIVLAGGGLAQGKHGGGNKHGGGDHWKGGGQAQRDGGGRAKFEDRGGDRGNRGNGNGNAWGRQKGGNDQRVLQQQQRQQQDSARQQHRQNGQNARQQQRQNEWNPRQQQQAQQDVWRQQQQAYRQYQNDDRGNRGRGKHNGWNADGPRGNAYGLRGVWPGEFRGWRDDDKWQRKQAKRLRNSNAYYYSDPIVSFYPAYRQQDYYSYNRPASRENVVRSIISTFFAPQQSRYYDDYYVGPAYQTYTPVYYRPQYYGTPYYAQAVYSPGYASPYYYNSYGNSPLFGTQLYGGGLKGSMLNIGLSLLQGFLGQGYQQGLYQGQYVRDYYGRPVNTYYGPYVVSEPVYYSPVASSFADQRQLFEEGYRLGYRDAMLDRDPYGTGYGVGNVDLVSAYLANTCINRI